jgi:hypothetical protein
MKSFVAQVAEFPEIPKPKLEIFEKIRKSRRERSKFMKSWFKSPSFANLQLKKPIPFRNALVMKPPIGSP